LRGGHYYELKLKDKKVGFCSISRFPHPKVKDIMTIGRIVIVPEFQGFGIGIKFISLISEIYAKENRVRITMSLKPFIQALNKHKKWVCVRFGRVARPGKSSKLNKNKKVSSSRITATFQYQNCKTMV